LTDVKLVINKPMHEFEIWVNSKRIAVERYDAYTKSIFAYRLFCGGVCTAVINVRTERGKIPVEVIA